MGGFSGWVWVGFGFIWCFVLLVLCLVFAFFMILQSCCELCFIVVCCFGFDFCLGWGLGFVIRFGL